MEKENTILIIAAYQPDGNLFQAQRYSWPIGMDEAICRTLDNLFTPTSPATTLQLRCFQSSAITPVLQFFPESNHELRLFLRHLSPTHTIDALRAYWLYKNGYSPLESNLDSHITDNILCYQKFCQLAEPQPTSVNQLIVRTIIGATSPQHSIDDDTLAQIAQIDSPRELETYLSATWHYMSLIQPGNAQNLIDLLTSNAHFMPLISTCEFTEQFESANRSTVQTALQLPQDKLNPAHKTILVITLNCMEAKLQLLSKSQTAIQAGIRFGSTIMPGIAHPLTAHLEHISGQITEIKKQITSISTHLYSVISTLSINTEGSQLLPTLTGYFNNSPHPLEPTIDLIAQCDYLPESKEICTQALHAFYQSACWKNDPSYAFSVHDTLLNKLSQLQAIPFPTDPQEISRLQPEEMPDTQISKYLEVLTHYLASDNSPESYAHRELLQQCTQHLSRISESIHKPLDFLPTFTAALSTGITAFLTTSSDTERQQFTFAARHYGLDTLLTQVQYRLTGGHDSDALVQSRYAETLLVNAITLLTQAIPQACEKKLLFTGWVTGIVELRSPNHSHMLNTSARLTTAVKSEVIHTLFANHKTGSWTEIDLYLDNARTLYNGVPPTYEEKVSLKNDLFNGVPVNIPFSPTMLWLLSETDILPQIVKLSQLHQEAQNITNLFDKEALRDKIACLKASIKSMPINN